ncbi:EF-hand calcium-binding domain-containing protein 1-like [Tubulanus polymorphus]|uniref:EF-hand calcium-binding domain-containing protein 1-like n=1 Tax=Tubulanus polymorphus TaxID=672921 RepID=UPI003DA4D8C6
MKFALLLPIVAMVTLFGYSAADCKRECELQCVLEDGERRCDAPCPIRCGKVRSKRNISFLKQNGIHVSRFPVDMDFYDINDDDRIYPRELSLALNVPAKQVMQMFRAADLDRNGYISENEFKRAPWRFENKNKINGVLCQNIGHGTHAVIVNSDGD